MKIIITRKDTFTSKEKKVPFVKLSYIDPTGKAGEILTTEEKYNSFGLNASKICTPATLKTLVDQCDLVSAEFDPRGYLTGLE